MHLLGGARDTATAHIFQLEFSAYHSEVIHHMAENYDASIFMKRSIATSIDCTSREIKTLIPSSNRSFNDYTCAFHLVRIQFQPIADLTLRVLRYLCIPQINKEQKQVSFGSFLYNYIAFRHEDETQFSKLCDNGHPHGG